jgi:hypothetical protein
MTPDREEFLSKEFAVSSGDPLAPAGAKKPLIP